METMKSFFTSRDQYSGASLIMNSYRRYPLGVDKDYLGGLWRGATFTVALLIGALGLALPVRAAEFTCTSGDVACLIDAINQANANGEANTIRLDAGTYTLTEVNNTTDGPNGLPSVSGVLTIRGAGTDNTTIERDLSAPSFRLVHVAATGSLTLEELTLRRGNAGFGAGGGLLNQGGTVSIAHTLFTRNQGLGAALANQSGGTVTIARALFVGNDSGVRVIPGGGISNNGTMTITESTIASNEGGAFGGGLVNAPLGETGTLLLMNSTIADNFADAGGGLANLSGGTVMIINTTIARNVGVGPLGGGGLINGGTVILTNSTLADNGISGQLRGGGISSGGTVILTNTILARNRGLRPDCEGPVTSLGNNLIGDPVGCTITLQPTDLTGDPGLSAFTDNGTPGNGHFRLLRGSPAIDAGNDAFCPPTDQLGRRRITCDIGAIRFPGGRGDKP